MSRRVVYCCCMFLRMWVGIGVVAALLVFAVPTNVLAQQATLGGPCVAPVDAAHTCMDVSGVSAADRTARDCRPGRCPGLADTVLCCRAAAASPAPAPAPESLHCERYICTYGRGEPDNAQHTNNPGYVNEVLTSLPVLPAGTQGSAPSYACSAVLNPSAECQRNCEYACSFYRRGDPGIATPYVCASTYQARCIGSAAPAAANTTSAAAEATDRGKPGRLGLPACATTHDPALAGKCTLDDIKTVAVNFANFLMGLAAAFFLAIFVWAGFKYIFFAYDSSLAADAKKTLTGAAIGMLLVLGAAMIVRFVQTTATGGSTVTAPSGSKTGTP